MSLPQISNLDELLRDYLGPEKTVADVETSRLTEIGENYGSQMLALKIHVKNKDEDEYLEAVAKVPPPGEFMHRMFNIPVTFRNEIEFYRTIIPELEAFLTERGINDYFDCFPEVLGGRLSLTKDEVDDDAVLLLENLKTQGYVMCDRTVGFDYETAKLIIKAIARYHAVPLAFKMLKPEVFQKKIRPLFRPYKVFQFDEPALENVSGLYRKMIDNIESCKQYSDRVVTAFRSSMQQTKNAPELIREPFSTIIHTDSWVNNFMVKYQDQTPIGCKIVDFQLGEYGSPARDVVFFIFTSVMTPVVQEHYDDLVGLYHQTLVDDLVQIGCDPGPFSMEKFQEETKLVMKEFEIFHCLLMLQPIFATKENLKELDEYKEEDMTTEQPIPPKLLLKLEFLIDEFVKRNWV